MKLSKHDVVICAYAEPAAGPGWSNTPVWVIIQSRWDGSFRRECLQPNEQSPEIMALYKVSAVAHSEMTAAVNRHLTTEKKKRS